MKIATYNIWNSNIEIREEQLIQEINNIDADIIGLQEVPPLFFQYLKEHIIYDHNVYFTYKGQEEGLAFLSKYPINSSVFLGEKPDFINSLALNMVIEINGIRYSVTNVHLPWDSATDKEKQIVSIDKYIHSQKDMVDFSILLGDFNCSENSSVHNYLLGNQSLLGYEAKPYWNDLASVHAALNGYKVIPTLDFINNTGWLG